MGTLIAGGLITILQDAANGMLWLLATVLGGIEGEALAAAQQPWVSQVEQYSAMFAVALWGLMVGRKALEEYILYNEGTAGSDGGAMWKGLLRTTVYGAAGTYLAYNVFTVGLWFGQALMAAPLDQVATAAQNAGSTLTSLPGLVIEDVLILALGLAALVVGVVIITIQMAIRSAELIFYIVASPIAALGQMNPGGGVWAGWWRGLVVLGLSQAVQLVGLKGILASLQNITAVPGPSGPVLVALLGLVLAVGMVIATIRGPHIIQQWAYHTGIGGAVVSGGKYVLTQIRTR